MEFTMFLTPTNSSYSNASRYRGRRVTGNFTGLGLMLAGLAGCATTPNLSAGNPLPGVGLEAAGSRVLMSWAPNSPLAQQLRANTNLQLVASYESVNGPVSGEPLSSTRVGAVHTAVSFELPDTLNNTATGPVCLRVVQNRRSIPFRIARLGESSDGFRYPEWVALANRQRQLTELKRDKQRIDRNVQNFTVGDPEFVAWQDRNGLQRREDCDNLISETGSADRPDNAVESSRQPQAASEQCVALFDRMVNERVYQNVPSLAQLRPGLTAKGLAQEIRANVPDGHRVSADSDKLLSDVSRYGVGRDYFEVARLPLNSATFDSFWLANKGVVSEADAVSLTETYSGCINETVGRFEQASEAWLANRDPALRRQLDLARQEECRARFDSFQRTEERLTFWRGKQAENASEIQALNASEADGLPSRKPLIGSACTFE